MKHAIIIVTYNRLPLLKECLDAVQNQKVKFDEIVIINNASTDGTDKYLCGLTEIDHLQVINRKRNIGGAGGFAQGIYTAYNRGAEWITIIDDDAILRESFLEEMCKAIDYFQGKELCFAGIPLTNGIRPNHRRRVFGKWVKYEKPVPIKDYGNDFFTCDIASFCGLMVNRRIIDMVGFPDKRFFIWYDDTEYSLRIAEKWRIVNWNKAIIDHKADVSPEYKPFPSWKDYYGIRNNIYTARKHYGFFSVGYIVIRKGIKGFLIAINCLKSRAFKKTFYSLTLYKDAIRDGIIGRLGINRRYYPNK